MSQVEKNDVNINKLFSWGRVFEITGKNDEVEALVYMRLLGDADINKARVFAVRKSAELRKKLHDPDSDDHVTTIRDITTMTEADMVNYIVMFSMRDIKNEALRTVKVKKPKEPKSDAALEDTEKFQAEVDSYPDKVRAAMEEYMKKGIEKLKKLLYKKSVDELYEQYKKFLIDEMCEMTATRAFKDMEIYLGCYKDDEYSELFFDNFGQYENLPTEVKLNFRSAYEKLNFPMDELKKLREATQ